MNGAHVHLCFIVEERYRDAEMPLAVVRRLRDWGHHVDQLEPQRSVTRLSAMSPGGPAPYDAYVLKTVSDGPGLSILEAAHAAGVRTVNDARAVRLVRDKATALTYARRHGLPMPDTYFVSSPHLLQRIGRDEYPLVVKPCNGSAGRSVQLVDTPDRLRQLRVDTENDRFLLAQRYVPNDGYDLKLYHTGEGVYASLRRSPLHPEVSGTESLVRVPAELDGLVRATASLFGLDIFGVDVVRGPDGWVVVDINDFPSFGLVPGAVDEVSRTIVRIAQGRGRGGNGSVALTGVGVGRAHSHAKDANGERVHR